MSSARAKEARKKRRAAMARAREDEIAAVSKLLTSPKANDNAVPAGAIQKQLKLKLVALALSLSAFERIERAKPTAFGCEDPWLDSDHDYEVLGKLYWMSDDSDDPGKRAAQDVCPTGPRGWLGWSPPSKSSPARMVEWSHLQKLRHQRRQDLMREQAVAEMAEYNELATALELSEDERKRTPLDKLRRMAAAQRERRCRDDSET